MTPGVGEASGKSLGRRAPQGLGDTSQKPDVHRHALNHWDELQRFTEDRRLEFENNTVERTLRLCVISRKNRLFVGRNQGGKTAATCFSILAGAKRHGIEPFEDVRHLLIALSSAEVDLRSLLPDVWIAAHPEHFLQYRRDEAEAAARARKRRRAERRTKSRSGSPEGPGPERRE
jgi:transposase